MQDQKKHLQFSFKYFYFPKASNWMKVFCINCITYQLNKHFPHQKLLSKTKILKNKVYILITENHLTQKAPYHRGPYITKTIG